MLGNAARSTSGPLLRWSHCSPPWISLLIQQGIGLKSYSQITFTWRSPTTHWASIICIMTGQKQEQKLSPLVSLVPVRAQTCWQGCLTPNLMFLFVVFCFLLGQSPVQDLVERAGRIAWLQNTWKSENTELKRDWVFTSACVYSYNGNVSLGVVPFWMSGVPKLLHGDRLEKKGEIGFLV